jgi:hypothetical protein
LPELARHVLDLQDTRKFAPVPDVKAAMSAPLKNVMRMLLSLGLLGAGVTDASACACCTEPGYRNVTTRPLDSYKRGEIQRLRFARKAQVFVDAGGLESLRGARGLSEDYQLQATQRDTAMTLDFRDEKGRTGTLVLALPESLSVFEIDPREGVGHSGSGPMLYKEWRLTGPAAGTGVFAKAAGPGQKLTLILHGGGLACTGAEDFRAWTLVLFGSKAEFSLFGQLETPK